SAVPCSSSSASSPGWIAGEPGQPPDAAGPGVYVISTRQGADLERVAALLARGQVLQLAARAGVQPAGVPVGAGLHRDHVGSGAELAPGDVVRERRAGVALVDAE